MMKKKTGKAETLLPPVRIEKIAHGGAGLGFAGGPVFIPLTAPGDLVVPTRVRKARGVFFAEPGEFMEYSANRVNPPCPWFGECGGCQWMHLAYPEQMKWKKAIVGEAFARIGKLGDVKIDGLHPSPVKLGYRHRARLHIEGADAGFFRRRSNTVVKWDRCLLLYERLDAVIPVLRSFLSTGPMSPPPRSCEVAVSPLDGGMTFLWNLGRGLAEPRNLEKAMDSLERGFPDNVCRIMAQTVRDSAGRDMTARGSALETEVQGARLKASPGTFSQVNPWTNEILVGRVLERLKQSGVTKLLDLFCGNGNFSIPAARDGIKVDGVDSSPAGIRDARAAAGDGCRFHAGDVEHFLGGKGKSWDAVLVDPPRIGLGTGIVTKLMDLKAGIIIYVSCEPATLSRDVSLLAQGGYRLRNVELFDMFPQTPHVEVMVEMERGK